MNEPEIWTMYGREMASPDRVTDIERARAREAQEALGLGAYPFAAVDTQTCGDRIPEGEA